MISFSPFIFNKRSFRATHFSVDANSGAIISSFFSVFEKKVRRDTLKHSVTNFFLVLLLVESRTNAAEAKGRRRQPTAAADVKEQRGRMDGRALFFSRKRIARDDDV